VRLKKNYSSREVAALTGLTARQLQWWDARQLISSAIASKKTAAGGFTERRYSPVDLFELLVLADLRRRGFTVQSIRVLLDTLRARFGVRLFDAIEGGPLRLFTDGLDIYARTEAGQFFSLLKTPDQPLLVLGDESHMKELGMRLRSRRKKPAGTRARQKPSDAPAS
jgi:DNA-binding transcriptional MerR regulator